MPHPSKSALTPYEQSALADAASALTPYRTPVSALVHVMESGADDERVRIARAPNETPDVVTHGLARILSALSELAVKTLRSERLNHLRRWSMRPVRSLADIERLDLWEVDEAVRFIEPKYILLGGALGLGSGAFGMRGLAVDKPLLTLLAMRQIHEYAARYGFDTAAAEERAFAVQIFIASLCPKRLPEEAGVRDLSAVTEGVRRASRFFGLFDMVRSVVRRVVRSRKSSSRITRVGAVAVAAYNVWFLRGVAHTAALAYRERFVARKHHLPLEALPIPHDADAPTSSAHDEACPPGPFEKKDEARPSSAQSGVGR